MDIVTDSERTQIRISRTHNERLKALAGVLGGSVADIADKALESIFTMIDGDDRLPLIVAEYRLKKSYVDGGGEPVKAAKRGKPSHPAP